MSKTYDTQTYLLDKSYIADTMTRMMIGFDGDHSLLRTDVYTPEIDVYYKSFHTKPETVPVEQWITRLENMHKGFDSTQHVIVNLLSELPIPTAGSVRPELCNAVACAHGYFYMKDEEGRPRKQALRNGGRYQLQLVRLPDLEEKGRNPWRLKKLHVNASFQDMGQDQSVKTWREAWRD